MVVAARLISQQRSSQQHVLKLLHGNVANGRPRTCAGDMRRGFREVEGKIVAVALSIAAERVAASCGSHRHHQQHAAAA